MWLSKMMARSWETEGSAQVGQVTISQGETAAITDSEHRGMTIFGPRGISWSPDPGSRALVIKTPEGYALAGVEMAEKETEPGELRLSGRDCEIRLGSDGRIDITGKVFINGKEMEAV